MNPDALSTAQRALVSTERWAWLAGFIELWCADPLTAEHGSSDAEIAAVTERTGLVVPNALAEWWALVGGRLHAGQDDPSRPQSAFAVDRALTLWLENQGVWTIAVRTDGSERCEVLDAGYPWPQPATVPLACRSMLMSDVLMASVPYGEIGPLGALGPEVTGGFIDDVTATERSNLAAAYPELDVLPNPFWRSPPRGDAQTLVRIDDATPEMLVWATATPAARQRLGTVIDLAGRSV